MSPGSKHQWLGPLEKLQSRASSPGQKCLALAVVASERGSNAERAVVETARDDDALCHRCRALDLKSYLGPQASTPKGDIATLTWVSPWTNCHLCVLLAALFHGPANGRQYERQGPTELILGCRSENTPLGKITYFDLKENIYARPSYFLFPITGPDHRPGHTDNAPPGIGRRLDPQRPDFGLVKQWLNSCRTHHVKTCGQAPDRIATALRVIDCKTRKLCMAPPGCPYIALSYLWGNTATSEESHPPEVLPSQVPKTVEGAIAVALALEIPYLWVDRYCINQNDADEKHSLIRDMDKVYQGAEVTIIASAGDNPHHGLPGIRQTTRRPQHMVKIGSYFFISSEDLGKQVRDSTWNSRGWTYQEMLLSRRRLVFTESQMYFQCMEMNCMEGLESGYVTGHFYFHGDLLAFPRHGLGAAAWSIYYRLTEYYQRKLSFDSDILNGIEGVFGALQRSKSTHSCISHFWGIPFSFHREGSGAEGHASFAAQLAWAVRLTFSRKSKIKEHGSGFPSWSWAAVKARYVMERSDALEMDITGHAFRRKRPETSRDVSVVVTHRSGERMNLMAYASHADHYTRFFPWLEFNSWSIWCSLDPFKKYRQSDTSEWLEFENVRDWAGEKLLAIYLNGFTTVAIPPLREHARFDTACLLAGEIEPGVFCRVGIWIAYRSMTEQDRSLGVGQLLERFTDSKVPELIGTWRRRTVRLV
ncbi:HET-domain-containing protein [Trematosphaeria pertusa]|uniref:HET-domain-containing protein n=1 Tax=Trematosphaeria pertusa TaxID=390896 RepID=A0A6A6I1F4_9PLEO|nr:HET-domain-containing protein [Trematosphaeria pertusa]KAF2244106.1 HET-domain-containing protein [Trematosphaeria pertusa]